MNASFITEKLISPALSGKVIEFHYPFQQSLRYNEGPEILDLICSKDFENLLKNFNHAAATRAKLVLVTFQVAGYVPQPASKELLFKICNFSYNRAIDNVNLLNSYKVGSSSVYGEITIECFQKILDVIQPNERDVFVDLGSGVGHLVTYIAGATQVRKAIGIEREQIPAGYAKRLASEFKKLVGKKNFPKLDCCAIKESKYVVIWPVQWWTSACFEEVGLVKNLTYRGIIESGHKEAIPAQNVAGTTPSQKSSLGTLSLSISIRIFRKILHDCVSLSSLECSIDNWVEMTRGSAPHAVVPSSDENHQFSPRFTILMNWFGKMVRPFQLYEGDFLEEKYRCLLTERATVLFINNFAFTPDLDERIKKYEIQSNPS
ncbi:unnamed protein product [Enterobius vermicularis]|uniref:Histone-lysine N-methyltransferase, H3 lysine-79 specific n=1 Tax=Enterobius vermicularis TaxID=51028 RepID=A0A0N4VG37_ENTVE|nr:unnamed protein product [Enterobius vermicularis]